MSPLQQQSASRSLVSRVLHDPESPRLSVYNFFTSYAHQHPAEQYEMVDWLARTLIDWVDPRTLAEFAQKLPTNPDDALPGLTPVIY
jgi:hypothetical protein